MAIEGRTRPQVDIRQAKVYNNHISATAHGETGPGLLPLVADSDWRL